MWVVSIHVVPLRCAFGDSVGKEGRLLKKERDSVTKKALCVLCHGVIKLARTSRLPLSPSPSPTPPTHENSICAPL